MSDHLDVVGPLVTKEYECKNTVALKCKMGHNHSGFLGIPGGWRQHLGKKVRRWPKMGNWGPIRGGGGSAFSGAAGGTARLFMSR